MLESQMLGVGPDGRADQYVASRDVEDNIRWTSLVDMPMPAALASMV